MRNRHRHGFSLVELSIVLAIIGLIAGGIFAGTAMVHAATVRATIGEVQSYIAAAQEFKKQYRYLPGDLPTATNYWGIAAGTTGNDVTCGSAGTTGPATCNGDGNGQFSYSTSTYAVNESLRAWQHLAAAGFVQGQFTGSGTGSSPIGATVGVNIPASKIGKGVGYDFDNFANVATSYAYFYTTNFVNGMWLGAPPTANNDVAKYAAISPDDAQLIDTKMDDGRPGFGNVMALKPAFSPGCASTSQKNTAMYVTGSSGRLCSLVFAIH
jgi:prepilin-type N-terminal cleavage/methylation domain-containing protein